MQPRPAPLVTLSVAVAVAVAVPVAVAVLAGCGDGGHGARPGATQLHLRPDQRPTPIGVGPHYRIAPLSPAVTRRAPVHGRFRCAPAASLERPYGVHLELFARGRVVIVPAGIGVAPPQRRRGAYVLGGACMYPIRTLDPTGVIRISLPPRARTPTLSDLSAIWGQPLTRSRLTAGFRGPVRAFVDGRRWRRGPGAIPLTRHAEIVLEVDARIPPHPTYRFPPGL
jgi:hypothetical protein